MPFGLLTLLFSFGITRASAQATSANPNANRAIGTITAINGNTVALRTDSGTETSVAVQDSTRIVKTAPGQKDLTGATVIHLQDLQVGDRALVRGVAENNSLAATSIIVMKQSDVANRQQEEMQEWQRHGVGGIVRSVDPASGTIIVGAGPNRTVAVKTSNSTQFLRYAPDSVKFSDAKKSSIDEVKPADQLRARGNRSPEGEVTAEAVISGSFRNIAGTVSSIDAAAGTLTVMDLLAKKPAIVKISPETQMRKIPPDTAQRIAMFLKRPAAGGGERGTGGNGRSESGQAMRPGGPPEGRGGSGQAGLGGQGSTADFQQVIRRMPAATISDLQKGDAVMIVTTQGAPGEQVTALTLLSGVEPILTAAPTQTSASLLSGWSMGGGGEGEN